MRGGVEGVGGRFRVRALAGVELAEPEAHGQVAAYGGVDVGLGQQALFQSALDASGDDARVGAVVGEAVHARGERRRGGLLVGVEVLLGVHEVAGRARVGTDEQVLVGPGAQVLAQVGREMVGAAVDQVVRGHHPGHGARLHGGAEGPQVVLAQDAGAHGGGRRVAVRLVVVGQPVLEHGGGAPVVRVLAAQAAGVGDGDRGGEPRVLRVALLVPAPQRVAEQVHRRRPEVEAHAVVPGAHRARLGGDHLADAAHQVVVPGGAEADGLREDGGRAHPGNAVQGFLSGAERGDAKPFDARGELVQERDAFAGGQPGQEVVHAPVQRQFGVTKGQRACGHVRIPLADGERRARKNGTRFEALRCWGPLEPVSRWQTSRTPPPEGIWHKRGSAEPRRGIRIRVLLRPKPSLNLAATSKRFECRPAVTAVCPGTRHEGLTP